MDSASPTADRIVGSEHVSTRGGLTLAEKFFAISTGRWTPGRLDAAATAVSNHG
ncbi:hypothetical protein [Halogranum rubrum]|uniref:Uncharacterized protein n=1 Tax=Halogranum salarium B-1 TaxID=1210908 RepID=J3ESS0_9EURY|nr:hypothetical protein [Halogranum salarium]EJN57032.1 hypothetical protein HSB1_44180 [Halogranum salarium B-1]